MDWRAQLRSPCTYPAWQPVGEPRQLSEPFDFVASEPHFVDHLAPVYLAIPAESRGRFYVKEPLLEHATARGISDPVSFADLVGDGPIVTASSGDVLRCAGRRRPLVLFEHGVGFSFGTRHPSYAGGAQMRRHVALFVGPNDYAAKRNLWAFRDCAVASVGCPKMDNWQAGKRRQSRSERPVVALSFHWDCKVAPEARWALPHYQSALPGVVAALSESFEVIGHGHPRSRDFWQSLFDGLGVEFVADFEDVLERADLYVNDASSTLYEFASTRRPVVCLNAPWYRRQQNFGLRFWEHLPGLTVDGPEEVASAVVAALADPPALRDLREAATDAAYTVHDGTAAFAAAQALTDWAAAGVIGPQVSAQWRRRVA